MKKLAFALFTMSFTTVFAQKVSDYQYISLPEKFESFKNDNYGLDKVLRASLSQKKYTVLPLNRSQWPAEANQNPCGILTADVVNDSGMLKNKVILQFKDCNNNVLASQKGASYIKEFEEGYQDALKIALKDVPVANPVALPAVSGNVAVEKTQELKAVEPVAAKQNSTQSNNAEAFIFNNTRLQKVQLSKDQFILVGTNPAPFATFSATGKGDVYRVKLENGDMGIGYYENGNLIIETSDNKGENVKTVLKAQ